MQPSGLEPQFWTHSLNDLETVVRLKFGFEQAKSAQEFENLAHIVTSMFGGKKSQGEVAQPRNLNEAKAAFAQIFGANSVG